MYRRSKRLGPTLGFTADGDDRQGRDRAARQPIISWRSIWLAILGAVAMFLILYLALPALAGTICNSGEFCVWGQTNGPNENTTGCCGDFKDWDAQQGDANWPCCGSQGVQNDDDSIYNRHTNIKKIWDGTTFTGGVKYCIGIGVYDNNIADSRDNDGNSHSFGYATCGGDPGP